MKKLLALVLVLASIVSMSPVGAQSYEGTSLSEGIYYLPASVTGGSIIEFAAEGLVPNSEIVLRLFDDQNVELDGLTAVLGAVVVRVDAGGNVNTDVRLPDGIPAGTYTLTVLGDKADGSEFNSSVVLQVAAVSATGNNSNNTEAQSLALTGSEPRNRALGGVLLVALGMGLVVVASQRRKDVKA